MGLLLVAASSMACSSSERRRPPPPTVNPGGEGGSIEPGGGGGGGGAGGGQGGRGGRAGGGGGGSDGGAADATPGAPELKITWWGSQDRHTRTIAVIEMFMARNPGIKITYQAFTSTNTEYWPMLQAMAEARALPDIMQHDHAYLEEWTAANHLLPLDDLVSSGALDLGDVPAGLVDGGKVDGRLMGVNLGSNTQAFVLDVDAFMRAGLAIPAETWTWNDFEQLAGQIRSNLGIWGFGVGLHGYTPGWKAPYLSAGAWVFSADNMRIGYTNDAPWVDHWKMILRLQGAGAIPTRAQELAEYPTTDVEKYPIVAGRSAMEQIHSNQLVALWAAAGASRNFKLLPIPRVAGRGSAVYVKPSQYWSITSTSRFPREAARFIDFFINDLAANEMLAAERGVPVANKVLGQLRPKLTRPQVAAFDLVDKVAPDARALPRPDPPAWSAILRDLYIPRVTDPIMAEQVTPEVATGRFRDEANVLLAGGTLPDAGAPPDAAPAVDGPPPPPSRALFVVGGTPLVGNDIPVQARLAQKLMVDVVPDATATTAQATGKALVVISATSSLMGVGTKYRDVPVPVLVMEPNLYAPMDLTGPGMAASGTVANQTQIAISAAAHPLAAGLPAGNVTVYSPAWRVVFGVPTAAATRVATVVGAAGQPAIFAYPAGAAMASGRMAPAKRIGFFVHNSTTPNLAPNGLRLLDAAVDWALSP